MSPSYSPDNRPVIVAAAAVQEKLQDATQCHESPELMAMALQKAATECGAPQLLESIDSIAVPQGYREYSNPAAAIAEAVQAQNAETILVSIGIPQLTLISNACQAILSGEQNIAVACGGEAKYRDVLSKKNQQEIQDKAFPDKAPDTHHVSQDLLWSDEEAAKGLIMPTEFYALIETALRYKEGLSIAEHREKISRIHSNLSKVAEHNPDAWNGQYFSPEELKGGTDNNPMLSFPYSKLHNTQWNVNQASAIVICSVKQARELNISEDQWVYPLALVQSCHTVPVSQRKDISTTVGAIHCSNKIKGFCQQYDLSPQLVELYSCFPSAVQCFANALELDKEKPLTVTGGMPFAGGPLNNFSLQGLVKLVELLREKPDQTGLLTNISGMIGKQAAGLFSATDSMPYTFEDVSEEVAKENIPVEIDTSYKGPATIIAYTVVYHKNQISHGICVCELPDKKRALGKISDVDLLQRITEEEFCGTTVELGEEGAITLRA